MTQNITSVKLPGYMLKNGSQSIAPAVNSDSSKQQGRCIYGFSGKPIYDEFIRNSPEQLLTPYPLVERFLAQQIAGADADDTTDTGLLLVVLDATSATQSMIVAATMATVLQAMKDKAKEVPVEFELVLDGEKGGYQLVVDG